MSWGIYVLHKNNLDYWTRMTLKVLEVLGIDPSTSRMLSEHSTIWATPPCWRLDFLIKYLTLFLIMVQTSLNCEMIGTKWSLFTPLHTDCSITGQDNSWDLLKIIRHWKFKEAWYVILLEHLEKLSRFWEFEGYNLKIGPATPHWILICYWQDIHFFCT